jgi:hypothetical protein
MHGFWSFCGPLDSGDWSCTVVLSHPHSDFHRYNLKRKVAGLPPVTKEWFEARKAQLSTAAAAPHTKIWYDPLTKKKFQTQQTYQVWAHVVDGGVFMLFPVMCGS